jgi:hypothetical protein
MYIYLLHGKTIVCWKIILYDKNTVNHLFLLGVYCIIYYFDTLVLKDNV